MPQLFLDPPHPPFPSVTPVLTTGSLHIPFLPAELSFNKLSQNQSHGTGGSQAKPQWSLSSPSPSGHVPRQSLKPLTSLCRWFLLSPCFPTLVSTIFMSTLLKQPCNWAPYSTISLLQLIPHTIATLIILKHHFNYQSSSYFLWST